MPIAANAAEAVGLSKSQNIPLVVAVLSEGGASSERELLESCNFSEVVFLCAPFGSTDALNFSRMFPLPVTPIVYFILPSGKAVSVLKNSFSCSDVHDSIAATLAAMGQSPSPPPPAPPSSDPTSDAASAGGAPAAEAGSLAQRKESAPFLRSARRFCVIPFGCCLRDFLTGCTAREACCRKSA